MLGLQAGILATLHNLRSPVFARCPKIPNVCGRSTAAGGWLLYLLFPVARYTSGLTGTPEFPRTASTGSNIRLQVLSAIGRGGSCTAYEAREADDHSVDRTKLFVVKMFAPEQVQALQNERSYLHTLLDLAAQKKIPTEIACGVWENMNILAWHR
jgi:hypothetical protein